MVYASQYTSASDVRAGVHGYTGTQHGYKSITRVNRVGVHTCAEVNRIGVLHVNTHARRSLESVYTSIHLCEGLIHMCEGQ